jgi:hypothetical protein
MTTKHWSVITGLFLLLAAGGWIYEQRCYRRSELSMIIPQGRQIMRAIAGSRFGPGRTASCSESLLAGGYYFEAGYRGGDQNAIQAVVSEANRRRGELGLNEFKDGMWYGFVPYSSMRSWHMSINQGTNEVTVKLIWN